MNKILTRYGDGTPLELTEDELMEDLQMGSRDATERG